MKNYHKILGLLALFGTLNVFAEPIQVNALAYDPQIGHLAFAVSGAAKHRVFVLDKPSRLVIDIKNARLGGTLFQPPASHPLFANVKLATQNAEGMRLIVSLKQSITSDKFSLSSNCKDGQHLQVDLSSKPTTAAITGKSKAVQTVKSNKNKSSDVNKGRDIIVAIDAGHGGNDPGAHGANGTEEKMVTFAIAKKLAALVNEQLGMKAVMVRKDDDYVGLRERMQIARAAKADLFISVHADAFNDTSVRGASVFTLSTKGASSEAALWLEKSENAAELVGGVNLSDKEEMLASVLLDLSQTATLTVSEQVAESVLKHFTGFSLLHKDVVQKAGFIVLKSPDIPSILVETAFISNPLEEQNLINTRYQTQMAKAIFNGILDYFKKFPPIDSRMAAL